MLMQKDIIRLFIAVELPQEVKDLALKIEKHLHAFKKLRFVRPEHMHITLAFLGERADVEHIRKSLKKVRFKPFILKTKGFGFFPSNSRIRVVWLGLERNEDFFKLQHDIRGLFDYKEKFMPHITLARARDIIIKDAKQLEDAMKQVGHQELEFIIDRFYLFSSELTPEGPIHKAIEEYAAE
jgi:2'-5' RNA ligase